MVGTPFSLNYRSGRAIGHLDSRTFDIPLSGATLPPGVKQIVLEIQVAGTQLRQTFPPLANLATTFTWDGRDAYGRLVQGQQPAVIRIGYVYDAVYYQPAPLMQAFGALSGVPISGNAARTALTLWQERHQPIGLFNAAAVGLGGWTIDVHHSYDPVARQLNYGDGRTIAGDGFQHVQTVAGNGTAGFGGDGGPATAASIAGSAGLATAPDGSAYIADTGNGRVRRVSPSGVITTVAGIGLFGFSGDGGDAMLARLSTTYDVAIAPDGTLYIADSGNHRVRKVDAAGIITTIAGTGFPGYAGDGGPAIQAQLNFPEGLAIDGSGNIYVADDFNHSVRRIDANGIITTVAGTGVQGFSGDGGPGSSAQLNRPLKVGLAPDGSILIADYGNHRVRRLAPNGTISTIAGTVAGFAGDGGPAIFARLNLPGSVVADRDGYVYLSDRANHRIRRIDPTGIITTFAGTGTIAFNGDGRPPAQTDITTAFDLQLAPDGSLLFTDFDNYRIRRISPPLPGYSASQIVIASESGAELYAFDPRGRHLHTLSSVTADTLYQFDYDAAGWLSSIRDGDGLVTTVERDQSGVATAILSAFGQRTNLVVDGNQFLARVTDPANDTVRLVHDTGGLLQELTDADGRVHTFAYDSLGRLERDTDAAGGFQELVRTELPGGHEVTISTALDRARTYSLESLANRDRRRASTDPAGLQTLSVGQPNGVTTIGFPDGMQLTYREAPDPRFGLDAAFQDSVVLRTPGGLEMNLRTRRRATLSDLADVLSHVTLVDTLLLNGRAFTSIYDAATRLITQVTPAGRSRFTRIDSQGRVLSERVPGLDSVVYAYNAQGLLTTATQGGRVWAYHYDAEGRLTRIQDPLARVDSFYYDPAGRLTRQVLPDGNAILYGYDRVGNPTSLTPPGRPAHAFTYTPVNLMATYEPPDVGSGATATAYEFDLDRQLTQILRPDSQAISFGYDTAGRLDSLGFSRGAVAFAYNATTGMPASVSAPDGIGLAWEWDGSLLTRETWTGAVAGDVAYTYDTDFRLASLAVAGATAKALQYDADGLLTGLGSLTIARDVANGRVTGTTLGTLSTVRTYDAFGIPDTVTATHGSTQLMLVGYQTDALDRITGLAEIVGVDTTTFVYAYDSVGRLAGVERNGSSIATYEYDANGNRTRFTSPNGVIDATYDDQDRLLTYGGTGYGYTAAGELTLKVSGPDTTRYDYDELGNLISAMLPSGTEVEYLIDGANRRIGRTVNDTLLQGFLYAGQLQVVAELDGAGNVISRFYYATRANVPDFMEKAGATYALLTDHVGSVRLVVNVATGQIAQRIDYDAFGIVLQDTNPGFQPFGFAGGLYDVQTGLVRFGARDYEPATGRWTLPDRSLFAGGSPNIYTYTFSDPVNLIDPEGSIPVLPWVGVVLAQHGYRILSAAVATVATKTFLDWWREKYPSFNPGEYCRLAARSLMDRIRRSIKARVLGKWLEWTAPPPPTPLEPTPQEQADKGPSERQKPTPAGSAGGGGGSG